jgi:hypothetical protein
VKEDRLDSGPASTKQRASLCRNTQRKGGGTTSDCSLRGLAEISNHSEAAALAARLCTAMAVESGFVQVALPSRISSRFMVMATFP